MNITQLALTWVGWQNDEKLALTCVQNNLILTKESASHCKSTQVHASANRVVGRPKFLTCVHSVWPGLKIYTVFEKKTLELTII